MAGPHQFILVWESGDHHQQHYFPCPNSRQSELGAWYRKSSTASSGGNKKVSKTVFNRKMLIAAEVWPPLHSLLCLPSRSHTAFWCWNLTHTCNLIVLGAPHPISTENKLEGSGSGCQMYPPKYTPYCSKFGPILLEREDS